MAQDGCHCRGWSSMLLPKKMFLAGALSCLSCSPPTLIQVPFKAVTVMVYTGSSLQIHPKSEQIYKWIQVWISNTYTVFSGQFLPDPRFVNPPVLCVNDLSAIVRFVNGAPRKKLGGPAKNHSHQSGCWTQFGEFLNFPKNFGISCSPLPNTQCMVCYIYYTYI